MSPTDAAFQCGVFLDLHSCCVVVWSTVVVLRASAVPCQHSTVLRAQCGHWLATVGQALDFFTSFLPVSNEWFVPRAGFDACYCKPRFRVTLPPNTPLHLAIFLRWGGHTSTFDVSISTSSSFCRQRGLLVFHCSQRCIQRWWCEVLRTHRSRLPPTAALQFQQCSWVSCTLLVCVPLAIPH